MRISDWSSDVCSSDLFDLGVLHRKDHEIAMRESLLLSAFYISLGLAFGGLIWWHLGAQAGQEYLIGFLIEKSLALDNIFVIALIFSYFGVPRLYQPRSVEHTPELQSLMRISYAVFCLKKKTKHT